MEKVPMDYVAGLIRTVKGVLQDESTDEDVIVLLEALIQKHKDKRLDDCINKFFQHQGLRGVNAYLNTIPDYKKMLREAKQTSVLSTLVTKVPKPKTKSEVVVEANP